MYSFSSNIVLIYLSCKLLHYWLCDLLALLHRLLCLIKVYLGSKLQIDSTLLGPANPSVLFLFTSSSTPPSFSSKLKGDTILQSHHCFFNPFSPSPFGSTLSCTPSFIDSLAYTWLISDCQHKIHAFICPSIHPDVCPSICVVAIP